MPAVPPAALPSQPRGALLQGDRAGESITAHSGVLRAWFGKEGGSPPRPSIILFSQLISVMCHYTTRDCLLSSMSSSSCLNPGHAHHKKYEFTECNLGDAIATCLH